LASTARHVSNLLHTEILQFGQRLSISLVLLGCFLPRTKAELFNYPTYIDDQGILTRNQLCFRSIRWIQNDFQLGLIWPALSRLEQTTAECHLAV